MSKHLMLKKRTMRAIMYRCFKIWETSTMMVIFSKSSGKYMPFREWIQCIPWRGRYVNTKYKFQITLEGRVEWITFKSNELAYHAENSKTHQNHKRNRAVYRYSNVHCQFFCIFYVLGQCDTVWHYYRYNVYQSVPISMWAFPPQRWFKAGWTWKQK